MLPQAHRGLQRSDFHRMYKSGKTLKTAFFRIKTAQNTDPGHETGRFGVVISAKLIKGAVKRNRLRRQIYAILAEIQPKLAKKADIVIIPEPAATSASFSDLRADLLQGFIKIGFLEQTSKEI